MDHEKLYRVCYMRVYSYVMTLARDPHLAEEITQETFFRAMTAGERATFRDGAAELTWLCAIAKRLFVDETRKRKHETDLPPEMPAEDDLADAIADRDLSTRIHAILHALEEPYKEVFTLRVFGELSFSQIGALFGKTETWARVTYHRARIKIKERMDSHG